MTSQVRAEIRFMQKKKETDFNTGGGAGQRVPGETDQGGAANGCEASSEKLGKSKKLL